MDKLSKVLFILWMVLAVAAFVGAFFISPLWVKIIGLVFGGLNICIVTSWIVAALQGLHQAKKMKDFEKEENS